MLAAVPADQVGENTGAGALAGAVILGSAGGSVGEGAGKAAAVVAGLVVGSEAGSVAEEAAKSHNGMAYTIRLAQTGQVITLFEHVDQGDLVFSPGNPVVLETDGRHQLLLAPGMQPVPPSLVP